MTEEEAKAALEAILWELPFEFTTDPAEGYTRDSFQVIKRRNTRRVHENLWKLQQYFGMEREIQ